MVIPREAQKITNSNELRNFRKTLALSEIQKDVLIGTLLGDGTLDGNRNYRLVISHSIKQRDYVNWKYEVFKNWTLSKPNYNPVNNSFRFRTVSHPKLTLLGELFYKDRIKIIPVSISKLLNPLVLAVWYMDDGNIRRQNNKIYGYYLNTQSFTKSENLILSQVLKDKFGLESYVLKNKNGYRLYFGSKSKEIFPKIIAKHILPSLQYKIR
ncbi:MAG: hypothetical protein A3C71_00995 [Candidatus Yanofskybacteria bacterium RIFCSPHIGHO2_02_FULL_43_15c]|uniref:Homing endonuclease LAGLIDADG domain-containing protein n=1 Tax=Candidatus Yanofskybacteria bacterium RIFCSPHIGHO2_02_FULL_43_15c TaxID=1802679 RepID=A0A1F8FJU9_9BACT|nr:MAG: hypothetical protein A3C71_00995 [Candidatus Yanofskybacteria bacterium RIFCSPHIGHO2_02_FULL_43_15c]